MIVQVAALFCCASGPYAALGADVYDLARDARSFGLDRPVVAHPPCRSWGNLRHMAKPRPDERDLAIWAIWTVRICGGVVEHPWRSGLWSFMGIRPGVRDEFGGLLVFVHQDGYGHRAPKPTGLYCVRCEVEPPPLLYPAGEGRIERMCRAERERTPYPLAEVLMRAAEASA